MGIAKRKERGCKSLRVGSVSDGNERQGIKSECDIGPLRSEPVPAMKSFSRSAVCKPSWCGSSRRWIAARSMPSRAVRSAAEVDGRPEPSADAEKRSDRPVAPPSMAAKRPLIGPVRVRIVEALDDDPWTRAAAGKGRGIAPPVVERLDGNSVARRRAEAADRAIPQAPSQQEFASAPFPKSSQTTKHLQAARAVGLLHGGRCRSAALRAASWRSLILHAGRERLRRLDPAARRASRSAGARPCASRRLILPMRATRVAAFRRPRSFTVFTPAAKSSSA